ncbi:MAG: protein containing prokaryotic [Pirellulaceae bacterium]|nr:MAG: protein containing prokaryotic [Pirellulaceae bacterium]
MTERHALRTGFTLVEVLVVILIISLLVALMIPVVRGVMRRAEDFRYAQDLANLEMAIHAYKEKYKDFPPDFSDCKFKPFDQTVAGRHIRMAFPRIDPNEYRVISNFAPTIDPAEALVFWLGGLSRDPKRPFTGPGGPLILTGNSSVPVAWRVQDRNEPLFDFDESRLFLEQNGGFVVGAAYLPPGGNSTPYVYFDSRTYGFIDSSGKPQYASLSWPSPSGGGVTIARPYKSDQPNSSFNPSANQQDNILQDRAMHWVNRDTFQLICAGRDGEFGPLVNSGSPDLVFPDGNGNPVPVFTRFPSRQLFHPGSPPAGQVQYYLQGQDDNLANFSEGQTMEQAKP